MLKKTIKKVLLFDFPSNNDYINVKTQINKDNRKFILVWAPVLMIYMAYSMVMSTIDADFHTCRYIYVVAFAVYMVTLILALTVARKASWIIRPLALAIDIAFLGSGTAIALYLAPKTIIIFASVLIIPVLFISDTLSTIILLIADAVIFAILGANNMDPVTYRWTLTNLIIFSSAGVFVGSFVNKARFERYVFAESNARLAEMQARYAYYDQMTGLKNRRSFSEMIEELSNEENPYFCMVMADTNCLKQTNDTIGHQAGDEIIIGSADCLRYGFKGIDTIYRIGGDEFCVILRDKDYDIENHLKMLDEFCAAWKGKLIDKLSISYGVAYSEEFSDLESVQRIADQRMYELKKKHYERMNYKGRD